MRSAAFIRARRVSIGQFYASAPGPVDERVRENAVALGFHVAPAALPRGVPRPSGPGGGERLDDGPPARGLPGRGSATRGRGAVRGRTSSGTHSSLRSSRPVGAGAGWFGGLAARAVVVVEVGGGVVGGSEHSSRCRSAASTSGLWRAGTRGRRRRRSRTVRARRRWRRAIAAQAWHSPSAPRRVSRREHGRGGRVHRGGEGAGSARCAPAPARPACASRARSPGLCPAR